MTILDRLEAYLLARPNAWLTIEWNRKTGAQSRHRLVVER